ncbi:MAG: BON domain-containing protein [Armatimonadetes bacterium]|nr:BON domain-containing protein [Armatimonadota bacterium]
MSLCNEAMVAVIRERLCCDFRIAATTIDICSTDGRVSIQGCVDTPEQKKLIVDIVIGMIGVREICCDGVRVRSAPHP